MCITTHAHFLAFGTLRIFLLLGMPISDRSAGRWCQAVSAGHAEGTSGRDQFPGAGAEHLAAADGAGGGKSALHTLEVGAGQMFESERGVAEDLGGHLR